MINLQELVIALDDKAVQGCLEEQAPPGKEFSHLYHTMILECDRKALKKASGKKHIVHMLKNAGLDVNVRDKDGNTPLHLALLKTGDLEICEALLQCGADMYMKNYDNANIEDCAKLPQVPEVTRELIKKYSPGLWRAVREDDIMSVRKLLNLWCRVEIKHRNGRTLQELAIEKGTEHIIRLITDIGPSMKLAHAVLASDAKSVMELCDGSATLNTEFKNMGDMGATPLFYAIMQNNIEIVEALCKKGAKITTTISFEDEDIPIYFAALNKETDPEIIKRLTPKRGVNKYFTSIQYRGRNVLLHCIENDVHINAVKFILHQGYPELVVARDKRNMCARDLAEYLKKPHYVHLIDEVVHEWYLDSEAEFRKVLALNGYPYLRQAMKDGVKVSEVVSSMETSSQQAKFDTQLDRFQDQVSQLHKAVERGNFESVRELMFYDTSDTDCFCCCLADSRAMNDGQPLLIKATLRNRSRILEYICQVFQDTLKKKIDDSRDTYYRTALHYAYANERGRDSLDVLLDYAASEFTMDKDDRSPMVFKDYRDHSLIRQLLQYHIDKDFICAEPDIWSSRKVRLPNCPPAGHVHSHGHSHGQSHGHSHASDRQLPPRGGQSSAAPRAQPQPAPPVPVISITSQSQNQGNGYYCIIL